MKIYILGLITFYNPWESFALHTYRKKLSYKPSPEKKHTYIPSPEVKVVLTNQVNIYIPYDDTLLLFTYQGHTKDALTLSKKINSDVRDISYEN